MPSCPNVIPLIPSSPITPPQSVLSQSKTRTLEAALEILFITIDKGVD